MLNEIKEFEQYTKRPFDDFVANSTHIGGRLKYNPFISRAGKDSKNTGLRRPMLIIARNYMFQGDVPDDCLAEDALLSWLGRAKENRIDGDIFNWLPDYINHLGNICDNASKAENAIDNLRNSAFKKSDYSGNTENEIIIGEVLDEAFRLGPLKRYYLFTEFNENYLLDNIFCDNVPLSSKRGNTPYDQLNQVLKTLAAYMLERGSSEQHRVPLYNIDICNWLITPTANKFDAQKFRYMAAEGPQIFKVYKKETEKNKSGKYYVPDEFLEKFNIVEEEEFEDFRREHADWNFYSDPGAGDNLYYNFK